jgi:hypothetical protein
VFCRVAFQGELQESAVKIQCIFDFTGIRILDKLLDVELEETVNVATVLNVFNIKIVVGQIS